MADPPVAHRFYGELAEWWPLISPPEEYEEEAAFVGRVLGPAREVLELGSGGGHVAFYLKRSMSLTLVDLSEQMLEVSRRLNPECEHLQGDMRTVRLGCTFDAVLVYDAIDYMTSEVDLGRAMETAFVHCRPGGMALFVPDQTVETYAPSTDHGGYDGRDGRAVRYLDWSWDPDPEDTWFQVEYVFVLRETEGSIRTVHETHRCGVFSEGAWLRLLTDTGFEPGIVTEKTSEDRTPRRFFIGRRPA